jgi:hypothetical protein
VRLIKVSQAESGGLAFSVERAQGGGGGDHLAAEVRRGQDLDARAEPEQRGPGELRFLKRQQQPALSPGFMRLERMSLTPQEAAMTESAEFPGRAVAALAADRNVLARSGQVLTTPGLAREYGFTDVDGRQQSPFWDRHWAGTWG